MNKRTVSFVRRNQKICGIAYKKFRHYLLYSIANLCLVELSVGYMEECMVQGRFVADTWDWV